MSALPIIKKTTTRGRARLECEAASWVRFSVPFRPTFRWVLDAERLVLVLGDPVTGGWAYEVDLERCATSAQVLNWIAQVATKQWASDEILAGLVRAINDVLKLQANLCGSGRERGPIDVKAVVEHSRTP